jgi:hypothetical protein
MHSGTLIEQLMATVERTEKRVMQVSSAEDKWPPPPWQSKGQFEVVDALRAGRVRRKSTLPSRLTIRG